MGEPRLLIEALYKYGGDREDRLTEVLASVLEVNHELCRELTERLGLGCDPMRFCVETQFGPPGQRRLVDLVLRGLDSGGHAVATVFIENKYNPAARLETYWFSEDQAMRQRRALKDEPGEQVLGAIASKSDLERLDGPIEARPRFDPRAAYDEVISWGDVRELIRQLSAPPSPRPSGRSGATPASDRLPLELLAYLELEGDALGALGSDDLFALSRILLAQDRVDRLLYRATKKLAEELSALDESDVLEFEAAEENEVENGVYYSAPAPKGTWPENLREAELYVMVFNDDPEEREAVVEPLVYVGVTWNAGREGKQRISGSKWESRARDASMDIDWEKNFISVAMSRPLREIADGGSTIAQQANVLIEWAHRSLLTVLKLPPPPNADEEEAGEEG